MTNAIELPSAPPYSRVQMFSGGGYRFGYYLGSYAALCDYDLKPDLILATCGGSLASLLVDIAAEPKQLKLLLESKALYDVVRASQSRQYQAISDNKRTKPAYFYQALKRWYLTQRSTQLSNLHQLETHEHLLAELNDFAMFEIDNEENWLNALMALKTQSNDPTDTPDVAIIASRIVPLDSDIEPANQQLGAQLQEILFTPDKLASYIDDNVDLQCPTHAYAPQRIIKEVHIVNKWDMAQAVRASMADMYYLQPTHINDLGWCLGGVINLTPIELASKLGHTVFAETKAPYDTVLASPAIQRIFGFDPNTRLNELMSSQHPLSERSNQHSPIHWLPFADNGKALAGQHVRKRLNIVAGRVDLIHTNYDGFIQQMQAQWHYGYERTANHLKANAVDKT